MHKLLVLQLGTLVEACRQCRGCIKHYRLSIYLRGELGTAGIRKDAPLTRLIDNDGERCDVESWVVAVVDREHRNVRLMVASYCARQGDEDWVHQATALASVAVAFRGPMECQPKSA